MHSQTGRGVWRLVGMKLGWGLGDGGVSDKRKAGSEDTRSCSHSEGGVFRFLHLPIRLCGQNGSFRMPANGR